MSGPIHIIHLEGCTVAVTEGRDLRPLKAVLGIDDDIGHRPNGAPYLLQDLARHISISHSRHFIALAVSDAAVGIDVEEWRPVLPKVVGRVTHPQDAETDPLRLWTAKEALFKAMSGLEDAPKVISEIAVPTFGYRLTYCWLTEQALLAVALPECRCV